tara:strand:- start:4 stop:234 length:231 start_codon:yes stop_codon:yes gene_type:complete
MVSQKRPDRILFVGSCCGPPMVTHIRVAVYVEALIHEKCIDYFQVDCLFSIHATVIPDAFFSSYLDTKNQIFFGHD